MKFPRTAVLLIGLVVILLVGGYLLTQEHSPSPGTVAPPIDGQESISRQQTPPTTVYFTPAPVSTQTRKPVEFSLDAGIPVSCGLTCRETLATITNRGEEVAHSVCVYLEVFNENGELIYINSGPSLERCLGDIPGKSSRSETIRIDADCGFLEGKCIGHTLILKSHATSLEKIQSFPDTLMIV
jgi:hypothetical protein